LEITDESERAVRILRAVVRAQGVPGLYLYLVSMCRWAFREHGWEVVPDDGSVFLLYYGKVLVEVQLAA
jgi:hypothetical protein